MITFTISAQILYFSAKCDFSRDKILNKIDFISSEQNLNLPNGQLGKVHLMK